MYQTIYIKNKLEYYLHTVSQRNVAFLSQFCFNCGIQPGDNSHQKSLFIITFNYKCSVDLCWMRFLSFSLCLYFSKSFLDSMIFRYDTHLSTAAKFGVDKGFGTGIGMGIFQVVILSNYALSLW